MTKKLLVLLSLAAVLTTACGPSRQAGSRRGMSVRDDGRAVTLLSAGKPVLSYNYAVTPAPEGVSDVYARSGYIHPAWTPSGFVLTEIQPRDHYHHYGIWNPWTKVEYEGKLYDLWNLGERKGTVRARRAWRGHAVACSRGAPCCCPTSAGGASSGTSRGSSRVRPFRTRRWP